MGDEEEVREEAGEVGGREEVAGGVRNGFFESELFLAPLGG